MTLTGVPSRETPLYHAQALADSVTAFEFRAPKGAKANAYIQGRYGIELKGTGDWQTVAVRFRAPRMDDGFTKIANALMLDVRVGTDVRHNVVFEKPSEGARWDAEDFRGPIVFYVTEGAFALRNVALRTGGFLAAHRAEGFGRRDQRKGTHRFRRARQGNLSFGGLRGLPSRGAERNRRELGTESLRADPPRGARARSRRRRGTSLPGEGQSRIPASLDPLAHADQLAVAESGPTRGQAYLPVMPAFPPEMLSDQQIDAHRRLSRDAQRTRPIAGRWSSSSTQTPAPPYDPMADSLQWLVERRSAPAARSAGRHFGPQHPRGQSQRHELLRSIRACSPS